MAASPRIVSLLPSGTEILCALGLADCLVGISHECDYPPDITDRPRLTTAKVLSRGNSQNLDQEIRGLLRQGLSVYQIDTDMLRVLQPDVIVTQDHCEVCAVPYAEVLDAVHQVLGTHVDVVSLRPALLQDIWDDIRHVGEITGRQRQADTLLEQLFTRVNAIVAESIMLQQLPRVAVIEWIAPLILAGNWIPELIQIGGGSDGLCTPGEHSPTVAWQQLIEYAPEVLAIIPCGYRLPQTLAELPLLQQQPAWETLPAVRQGAVYAVDGNAYFNRPGPRIVESLEILAGLLHPALFGEYLLAAGDVYQRIA